MPYVDPDCGGVNARLLLVLEAPAGAAAHGSHMLSADNNDGTAANVWRAYDHSGLPRGWGVHWNAVPWYIGVPGKIRAATAADVAEGRRWLLRLVDILPDLRVLLTLGNRARDAVTPAQSPPARLPCVTNAEPVGPIRPRATTQRLRGGVTRLLARGCVRRSRMPRHWLFDREDPRTVLAISVLVLVVAIVVTALGTGIPGVFLAVWLAAAIAQVVYAIVRLARERMDSRRPDGSL